MEPSRIFCSKIRWGNWSPPPHSKAYLVAIFLIFSSFSLKTFWQIEWWRADRNYLRTSHVVFIICLVEMGKWLNSNDATFRIGNFRPFAMQSSSKLLRAALSNVYLVEFCVHCTSYTIVCFYAYNVLLQ